MSDRVQRGTTILVGLSIVGVVGWMTYKQLDAPRAVVGPSADASSPAPSSSAVEEIDASTPLPLIDDPEAGAEPPVHEAAGALPQGAPRSVRLGVVLVVYAGAEGAPRGARPKRDAAALAEKLADEAKTNFRHAVLTGDQGSAEDIGRIPRGVLDPHTEVTVFGLPAGTVSDVLETPRGYWIVKRIE